MTWPAFPFHEKTCVAERHRPCLALVEDCVLCNWRQLDLVDIPSKSVLSYPRTPVL